MATGASRGDDRDAFTASIRRIKASLASANPSSTDCPAQLRQLLGLDETEASQAPTSKNTTISSHARVSIKKRIGDVAHKSTPKRELSLRDRRTIATEIANSTLALLSPKSNCGSKSAGEESPRSPLKQLAGNKVSKSQAMPDETKPTRHTSQDTPSSTQVIAECCHISFSYLRDNSASFDGRLCDGSLVLCARLFSSGCHDLAIAELHAVNGMLANVSRQLKSDSRHKKRGVRPISDDVAHLLNLDLNPTPSTEDLRRAIIYQSYVLKSLAISRRKCSIETILLALDHAHSSPKALIMRYLHNTGDKEKCASYLESISTALLQIAPVETREAQGQTTSHLSITDASNKLRLQAVSLGLRRQWWDWASHEGDIDRSAQLFLIATKDFLRSAQHKCDSTLAYQTVRQCYDTVNHSNSNVRHITSFAIHNELRRLAFAASKLEDEAAWLGRMGEDIDSLPTNHCARIIVLIYGTMSPSANTKTVERDIENAATALKSKIVGDSNHYKNLVSTLNELITSTAWRKVLDGHSPAATKLVAATLHFSQWLYTQNSQRFQEYFYSILRHVLRLSISRSAIYQTLRKEALTMLIERGGLKAVSQRAHEMPSQDAWQSSHDSVMLAQIIELLTLKTLRSPDKDFELITGMVATSSSLENILLLEAQMRVLLRHAEKSRAYPKLMQTTRHTFDEMTVAFQSDPQPLRRRTFSIYALRAYDYRLLTQKELRTLLTTNDEPHGFNRDQGLDKYSSDILACHSLASYLSEPFASSDALEQAYSCWNSLLVPGVRDIPECYESSLTLQLIDSLAAYQRAMGQDLPLLRTLVMKLALQQRQISGIQPSYEANLAEIVEHLLRLGHDEQAYTECTPLTKDLTQGSSTPLSQLRVCSALAQVQLKKDDLKQCQSYIERGAAIGRSLTQRVSSADEIVKTLHACANIWLVKSNLCLRNGSTLGALSAAKQAVRATNSAWQQIEAHHDKATTVSSSLEDSDAVSKLITGVSKLQLMPTGKGNSVDASNSHGSLYWSAIPESCTALMHLSDIYAHLGDFANADIYSQRAITMSDAVKESSWQTMVGAHRVVLLTKAGLYEAAELQISRSEPTVLEACPATVQHLAAAAFLRSESMELIEAEQLIDQAHVQAQAMSAAVQTILRDNFNLPASTKQHCCSSMKIDRKVASRMRRENPSSVQQAAPRRPRLNSPISDHAEHANETRLPSTTGTSFSDTIELHKSIIMHRSGRFAQLDERVARSLAKSTTGSQVRQLQSQEAMRQVMLRLREDLRYNALHETALMYPCTSFSSARLRTTSCATKTAAVKPKATTRSVLKRPTTLPGSKPDLLSLSGMMHTVLSHLQPEDPYLESTITTANVHSERHCVADALLYETVDAEHVASDRRLSLAFNSDVAAVTAHHRQRSVYLMRTETEAGLKTLPWPTDEPPLDTVLDQSDFQTRYVDIIPSDWTVVSLQLDQTGKRLQIVRYRSQQEPTIVSLPFARQESDSEDETVFNYQAARFELHDIIDSSNKTCHAGTDHSQKQAKADWWSLREDLDRRLGILLTTIEERWLGGFKGILSTETIHTEAVTAFRQSFQAVLKRHLLSRTVARQDAPSYTPDDLTIELFLHLGSIRASALNEPEDALLDLLNFILDNMRLRGDDIVHDEVDFDQLVMDLYDAISDQKDVFSQVNAEAQHLVLVLDKRLQAFPWESMPCLEGVSVSRVSSMQSLREQILAMKNQCRSDSQSGELYTVAYDRGTTILNPASDLVQTQAALMPRLTALQASKPRWNLMANQPPSEEEFSDVLQQSSIMLYFGHGSGAQYIRPQVVRRLKQRSDVVWLMGCSSGAVVEHDSFEPSCIPLSYLMSDAGGEEAQSVKDGSTNRQCLAVLANLWDVTDKDIDRFAISVGEDWGLWSPEQAMPRGSDSHQAVRDPKASVGTPRTPKPRHGGNRSRTPSRNGRKAALNKNHVPVGLAKAVSRSRDSCFLRYLNGAAPVVYGVPVLLDRDS